MEDKIDKLQYCWDHECECYGMCSLYMDGDIKMLAGMDRQEVPKCLYFWMKLYGLPVCDNAGIPVSEEEVWNTAAKKRDIKGK